MSKINIDLVTELQKYEKERQNLLNTMNQTQQRVNELQTQVIRREGLIAWIRGMLQEEAVKQLKKPKQKPSIKDQKKALMERAKKQVEKAKNGVKKAESSN